MAPFATAKWGKGSGGPVTTVASGRGCAAARRLVRRQSAGCASGNLPDVRVSVGPGARLPSPTAESSRQVHYLRQAPTSPLTKRCAATRGIHHFEVGLGSWFRGAVTANGSWWPFRGVQCSCRERETSCFTRPAPGCSSNRRWLLLCSFPGRGHSPPTLGREVRTCSTIRTLPSRSGFAPAAPRMRWM